MDDRLDSDWVWDDGEWVDLYAHEIEHESHLAMLEREDALRRQYPNTPDLSLIPIFLRLRATAQAFHETTGNHLQVYRALGELFGAIMFGIPLHKNYAQGSDGRLGDDFVEIKTITPGKSRHRVELRTDRHFSKVLVVRIDEEFRVSGRMIRRKTLPVCKGNRIHLDWDRLNSLDADLSSATLEA